MNIQENNGTFENMEDCCVTENICTRRHCFIPRLYIVVCECKTLFKAILCCTCNVYKVVKYMYLWEYSEFGVTKNPSS